MTAATSESVPAGGEAPVRGRLSRLRRTTAVAPSEPASAVAAEPSRPSAVIALERVTKVYAMGDIDVHALRGVSLTVDRGDFVAIMGASGSGKSTMMHIIGCLDTPTRGRYWLDGVDVRRLDEATLARVRNRKIGFIFQSFNLIPRTSAVANVELPLTYAGMARQPRRRRAVAALQAVGLGDRLDHVPSEMSGGQQQRVAVARAIATNPALILADEPTGNLDSQATHEVLGLFSRLNAEHRTVVLITHEPDVAAACKRVIRLRDGEIIEDHRSVAVDDPPPMLDHAWT
jgi:putative ABC transport system ATP-binding protein